MPFTCKLTDPEPHHQPSPYQPHTQSQYFPSPKSSRAKWRCLETTLIAQSLLELFKLANPKLFALHFLFCGNPIKDFGLGISLAPASVSQSIYFPCGPACVTCPCLRKISNKNLLSMTLASLYCHSVISIN